MSTIHEMLEDLRENSAVVQINKFLSGSLASDLINNNVTAQLIDLPENLGPISSFRATCDFLLDTQNVIESTPESTTSDKLDDYILLYCSKISVLNAHEATSLLLGYNPVDAVKDFSYSLMFKLIERAQLNDELKEMIKPKELLEWTKEKGLNFPEKYAAHIKRETDMHECDNNIRINRINTHQNETARSRQKRQSGKLDIRKKACSRN